MSSAAAAGMFLLPPLGGSVQLLPASTFLAPDNFAFNASYLSLTLNIITVLLTCLCHYQFIKRVKTFTKGNSAASLDAV